MTGWRVSKSEVVGGGFEKHHKHHPAGWARCASCGDLVPEEMARRCSTVDWGRHYEQMLCPPCYGREVDDDG